MAFEIENQDTNGREGLLEIENKAFSTPKYVPAANDLECLRESKLVDSDSYTGLDIGIVTQWLGKKQLTAMKNNFNGEYGDLSNNLKSKINKLDTNKRLLHFEFFKDVNSLDKTTLKLLLTAQYNAGADVIEIPNVFSPYSDINKILSNAIEWKNNSSIDRSLIGIACLPRHVITLSKSGSIDGIGLNLRYGLDSVPLMYAAEEHIFKEFKDIWVHGYSVHRSYNIGKEMGTYGMLMNNYGIDSISPFVNHIGGTSAPSSVKYYSPKDYSVKSFKNILESDFSDHKLSEFCDCPICKKHTVNSIISGDEITYKLNRAHEVLAHKNESNIFKEKIRESTTNQYVKSKKYAKRLIFG